MEATNTTVQFVVNAKIMREIRKAKRITTPRVAYAVAHTDLTETMRRDAYIADNYHNQNLYTQETEYDEFNDIDNELDGLTVFEPLNEVELFQFCTGYDVI